MALLPDLLGRLSETEEAAARIYWKSSCMVGGDTRLEALLKDLSAEEDSHTRLLMGVDRHIRSTERLATLEISEEAVEGSLEYLSLAEKRLDAGRLSNEKIVECLAVSESSEWNREFLKVVSALKDSSRLFIPAAAAIQQHKRSVERYLGQRPGAQRLLDAMRSLPQAWEERLLVVDGDRAAAEALSAALEDEGTVDVAGNGAEALERIRSGYYAAIVTDLSLPVMNAGELVSEAEERFPGIRSRFLVFTADPEGARYFRERGVRTLMRPAGAQAVAGEVASILVRAHQG